MFGSSMLDIAIGVVFVFLLLSIIATGINEIIMSAMNMRAKELLRGIESLLNDKNNTNGLVQQVYTHGQVYGLYRGTFDVTDKSDLPSYIPSRNFALALLDIVAEKGDAVLQAAPAQAAPHPAASLPPLPQPLRQVAPATPPVTTLVAGPPIIPIPLSIRRGAAAYAENTLTDKLGKPLIAMIAMAGNDANKLQKAVEDWYNSAMDRVSGWYKNRTQKWLLSIGLVMAISINADTLRIVRQLSKDSTLRQSIVAAAQNSKPPQSTSDQGLTTTVQTFRTIDSLGIPIGWHGAPDLLQHPFTGCTWTSLLGRARHWDIFLGWILTAIAVSLGAPFWFDALNKIMVIRSTVKPTEKSKDEASKS
jgi:hypothetical protein